MTGKLVLSTQKQARERLCFKVEAKTDTQGCRFTSVRGLQLKCTCPHTQEYAYMSKHTQKHVYTH